jgi:hypothetical protein
MHGKISLYLSNTNGLFPKTLGEEGEDTPGSPRFSSLFGGGSFPFTLGSGFNNIGEGY